VTHFQAAADFSTASNEAATPSKTRCHQIRPYFTLFKVCDATIVTGMDDGWWTLKCQSCRKNFEIELYGSEAVIEFARDQACPHCHVIPNSLNGDDALSVWHHVVGFRAILKSSP
jgi:Zn finger protein HypA/HybF involved in hydrogenase expression